MIKQAPHSVVFAHDTEGEHGGACFELSSTLCVEFENLDVQCRSVTLGALLDLHGHSATNESTQPNPEAESDISCELVRLGKSAVDGQHQPSPSTLVLVVDSHSRTCALETLLAVLQEWSQDFRISKTLLSGLSCAFVACSSEAPRAASPRHPSKEVDAALFAIGEAFKALGARVLLDEPLCFGTSDIGQIVTFTNLVHEAWDGIVAASTQSRTSRTHQDYESSSNTASSRQDRRNKDLAAASASATPFSGRRKAPTYAPAISETKCCSVNDDPLATSSNFTAKGCCAVEPGSFKNEGACQCVDSSYATAPAFAGNDDDYTTDEDVVDANVNGVGCAEGEDIENFGAGDGRMVTETQRQSLTKQGYKLIGDHSAVKLCRWTKARVRGHGGCYKHTFYGIRSNQCMEMTPSLACANKCVFCWRHHTNPVATRWKWPMDDPEFLAQESVKAHLRLIKELRGIFDTKSERLGEAMQVRHCALSLVGEPIMYPQINDLLLELHKRNISSFLVTNAQFPKEMEHLRQVTQLYVSIDAADEASLKRIDRPLFRDFWVRFQRCIQLLKNRKERTVFRLTLVKHFNISEQRDEIGDYGRLMELGEPDFVEIKAVTFCGTVHDNAITMENVPWHDEVVRFAQALVDASPFTREHYDIACEHRHSCCVLVAKKSFRVAGKWHTWIDYDKFHELATSGREFHGLEYSVETPDWALFGSAEQGFDPVDTRYAALTIPDKLPMQRVHEGTEEAAGTAGDDPGWMTVLRATQATAPFQCFSRT
ncbi:S-adenosyl-L-methionine-dependent tRNA 4-demethylwyosine synthase [Babesia caballi]|uniref:S-adenosyl-L-methionine-dependent tRNA 4-demethylwyosine synthase n=1 Tax=Babesia caballi TaxID=5871 RepID=A0AAV4M096_BABCB|nr:S-adenosyl-L-methionine-dependent tRNA 4-demethylwyosine synthase [Babesia caballi]